MFTGGKITGMPTIVCGKIPYIWFNIITLCLLSVGMLIGNAYR